MYTWILRNKNRAWNSKTLLVIFDALLIFQLLPLSVREPLVLFFAHSAVVGRPEIVLDLYEYFVLFKGAWFIRNTDQNASVSQLHSSFVLETEGLPKDHIAHDLIEKWFLPHWKDLLLVFLLLLTSGLAYVAFRLLLSSCLDLLLWHVGGRLDYGCLIDHRFDEDCLELLARSEVQLELFMQVSRIGAWMIQRGFNLAH